MHGGAWRRETLPSGRTRETYADGGDAVGHSPRVDSLSCGECAVGFTGAAYLPSSRQLFFTV